MSFLNRHRTPIALFGFTLLVFAITWSGEFLRWDDRTNIVRNPWLTAFAVGKFWLEPYYNLYVPVIYSVWTGIFALTQGPWAFHLFNTVVHAVNAVLVYKIARRIFPETPSAAQFAALLFAVHPLQVEAVAWISGGRDVLAASFALSALYLLLACESRGSRALSVVFVTLALLSKPTVAPLPFAGALLLWLRPGPLKAKPTLLVWLGLSVAAGLYAHHVQSVDAGLRLQDTSMVTRLLVMADALGFYLGKFLLPVSLNADYGRTPEKLVAEQLYLLTLPVLAAALAALAWRIRRGQRDGVYHLLIAVLFLTPVLGIIPFQAQSDSSVADRYMYLPMLGLAIFAGKRIAGLRGAGYVIVAVLAALSIWRANDWRTNAGFFNDIYRKNPRSYLATTSLGVEAFGTQDWVTAEKFLLEARTIKPMNAVAAANLAQVYWSTNRPEMITQMLEPLLRDPEFMRLNQTEEGGISALFRQAARANWKLGDWERANVFYCRFYDMDYENYDGRREIADFLKQKAERGLPVDACVD